MPVPQIPQSGLGRSQSGSGNCSVDVNADGMTPGIRSCVTLQMRPSCFFLLSGLGYSQLWISDLYLSVSSALIRVAHFLTPHPPFQAFWENSKWADNLERLHLGFISLSLAMFICTSS